MKKDYRLIRRNRLIFILFFALCFCSIFYIFKNTCFYVKVNAENITDKNLSSSNQIIDNFEYFSSQERIFRTEHPNATPDDVTSYLTSLVAATSQNRLNGTRYDGEYSIFGKTITSAELALVVAYPAQAVIAYNASQDASVVPSVYYNGGAYLNNADALRHAYWNALMERRISKNYYMNVGTDEYPIYELIQIDFAKEFADAHESNSSGIDAEMDLHNNALGRIDGATYTNLTDEQLSFQITRRITLGEYWKIANPQTINGEITGEIVPTDDEGLKLQYYEQIVFNSTILDNNTIRLDGVNLQITGAYTLPNTIGEKSITEIGDYAFSNQEELTTLSFPNTITSIGANAFENCANLTSVSGLNNIVSIGAQAFKGCSSLMNVSISAGTTSIGAGAFAGCSNLNITVSSSNPNYSASGNILYNKTGTVINSACNISDTITIPNTVTEISPYAFYDNDNLETLHIYGASTIGLSAFANCENLTDVYCYSYTVPTLGLSAFSNDTFTLYTPHSKQSQYVTAFAGYVNTASSIPITISFSSDGTVIDTLNTYFGANITGLTNPSKTGYNFAGWYDNIAYTGTVYTNGGLWDTTSNLTVYAKWSPQTYYIYFTGYGSENLADKEVTYDALIGTMPSVSRTGYTFYGWKNQYNEYFTSDMIWQKLSNQTVSSDLRANQYTITYNGNGGTANAQSQSVYYDGVISSFVSAYREGYTFTGWNTNANGSGQTFTAPYTYVIDDNTTLYAQYTANEYNVTFDKQGGTGGSDGVNATYNSPMPSGTSITAPTKNGYTFLGYYRYADGLGTKYYNADMTSANIWNLSDATTLFAYWSANQYTVTLDQQNGAGGTNSVNATYNAAMPSGANITAPTRTGYTFQGYFQYVNGSGTKYYNSDMTSHNVWNVAGNSTVYAHWTPNTYNISLQLEGGINGTTIVQATYNAPMNSAVAPTRVGYTFQGYYSLSGGSGTKYYNADMSSAHVWDIADNGTLYAYWLGDQFTVTFNKQGGSGGTTNTNVVYGSAMPAGLTAPTKNLYVFMGYYDGTTNDSTMYYDSNMVSAHNWDKLTNATLYAHWRGVYYTITYSNLTFLNQTADVLLDHYIGNYAPTYYEYGVGLDLTRVSAFYQSSSPYSPQLRFLGWYTSKSFSTQKKSISQSSTGNVTIYAKWKYDYDNPSRIGTYTINNADPLNQTYYDQNYIGLGYNNLYQNLINIGITKLTFSFKLRSWGEGTQHIFVYNESGTQLASTTFSSTSSLILL